MHTSMVVAAREMFQLFIKRNYFKVVTLYKKLEDVKKDIKEAERGVILKINQFQFQLPSFYYFLSFILHSVRDIPVSIFYVRS